MVFKMFEYDNTKTKIRILSAEEIYKIQWQKILKRLVHLGYDFPDIDSVKKYFGRGTWLNPDQTQVVLEVFGFQQPQSTYPKRIIDKVNAEAIRLFGTTHSWSKAGYVLTNGALLDLSQGQYHRVQDHRVIAQVMNPEGHEEMTPYKSMVLFINYGNIRIHEAGFEVSCPPTQLQRDTLTKYLWCKNEFYVEIVNYEGINVYSRQYHHPFMSDQVFGDIDNYFESLK